MALAYILPFAIDITLSALCFNREAIANTIGKYWVLREVSEIVQYAKKHLTREKTGFVGTLHLKRRSSRQKLIYRIIWKPAKLRAKSTVVAQLKVFPQ